VKDDAQVVHIPASLEVLQLTNATTALPEDGPMPPVPLHKTIADLVASENIRPKKD
jgi:hypothetical protein